MQTSTKPISEEPGTTSIENLPCKIVHYPGHHGAFFGFQESEETPVYLCACSQKAVSNYLDYRNLEEASPDFPLAIVNESIKRAFSSKEQVFQSLRFQGNLCHECNKKIPSFRFCHEGGAFRQNLGWYKKKLEYEYGIGLSTYDLPNKHTPDEIKDLIVLTSSQYMKLEHVAITEYNCQYLADSKVPELREAGEAYQKQYRKINRLIDNTVRRKFGFKKATTKWTSETILYYIIRDLFPDSIIHKNYRPDWLNGLEIDIYIEDLKVAVEYQGIQHYEPVSRWGGQPALEKIQERDARKKVLLSEKSIELIYFTYLDGLSASIVKQRMNK